MDPLYAILGAAGLFLTGTVGYVLRGVVERRNSLSLTHAIEKMASDLATLESRLKPDQATLDAAAAERAKQQAQIAALKARFAALP